jgi:uncharacterized protein
LKLVLFFIFSLCSFADVQLINPVVDDANIIELKTKNSLNKELMKIYQSGGPQIQIYTLSTLNGVPIEDYSIDLANKKSLGSKTLDNGILVVIAKDDRTVRIEVGSGLEGELTDIESSRIIDEMKVFFKKEEYNLGVLVAVKGILEKTNQEIEDKELYKPIESSTYSWKTIGILILIVIIIILFLTGNGDIAFLILEVLLRSGGRGSSSSSWGSGGGGFSGGGSSGKW